MEMGCLLGSVLLCFFSAVFGSVARQNVLLDLEKMDRSAEKVRTKPSKQLKNSKEFVWTDIDQRVFCAKFIRGTFSLLLKQRKVRVPGTFQQSMMDLTAIRGRKGVGGDNYSLVASLSSSGPNDSSQELCCLLTSP